jgi:hypothetical protein
VTRVLAPIELVGDWRGEVARALDAARAFDARVTRLHVVAPGAAPLRGPSGAPGRPPGAVAYGALCLTPSAVLTWPAARGVARGAGDA